MNARRLLSVAPLQIVQALVGIGAIAAFTRLMSPEEFGRYALALSASMAAHTLLFTWAEAAAFRFFATAKAERRLRDHYATLLALVAALATAVLIATAALLFIIGLHADIAALSAFAAAAAVFRFLTRITRESDRAQLALGRFAALETAYVALGFAAGVAFLIVVDLGAAAPFAGMMVAGAMIALIDAPRLLKRARGGVASPQRAFVYAAYGAPLALALAVDLCVQTLARFIVAHEAGPAALGAYAAAFGLARPLDLIFIAVGAALSPALMRSYEGDGPGATQRVARNAFAVLAALALPAAAGLALIAQPLSALMLGAGLRAEAAAALPWLALAGIVSGFNLHYWSEAFQLSRQTGRRALLMVAPGAAQITLTLLLAPTLGALGAAIAAAAGAMVGAAALMIAGRTLVALPIAWRALGASAGATVLMTCALVLWPAPANPLALSLWVALGAAIYGAGAVALNLLGARDVVVARITHLFLMDRVHAR